MTPEQEGQSHILLIIEKISQLGKHISNLLPVSLASSPKEY